MAVLATDLAKQIEPQLPGGLSFALFLYEQRADPQNGHVFMIARDRNLALPAVATYVAHRLDALKAKARG